MRCAIALLIIVSVYSVGFLIYQNEKTYVRGVFGSKCYQAKEKHGNIQYPLYYKTYEECIESIILDFKNNH